MRSPPSGRRGLLCCASATLSRNRHRASALPGRGVLIEDCRLLGGWRRFEVLRTRSSVAVTIAANIYFQSIEPHRCAGHAAAAVAAEKRRWQDAPNSRDANKNRAWVSRAGLIMRILHRAVAAAT